MKVIVKWSFLSTGNRTIVKPHQLVIINLQTDKVIHRFNFPENVLTPVTVLASLTIDTPKGSCGDAFAYFPGMLCIIWPYRIIYCFRKFVKIYMAISKRVSCSVIFMNLIDVLHIIYQILQKFYQIGNTFFITNFNQNSSKTDLLTTSSCPHSKFVLFHKVQSHQNIVFYIDHKTKWSDSSCLSLL